jgi:polysaccharide export outer membrane protein
MNSRKSSAISRRLTALLLLSGLIAATSGCTAIGNHQEKKVKQYGVVNACIPRELEMTTMPPYVVEPPDELDIAVRPSALDVPQTTATVQADGTIDLGFVGDVYVTGLTLREVEEKIAAQLAPQAAQRKIREPIQVSVRLVNGRESKRYYVLGTVTNQASFPITGNETVLDGILQAQLRSNSLPEKAYLVRPHPAGGKDQVFAIDWFGIKDRGDTLTNYQLMPGDRLVVPGGKPPSLISTLLGGG